MDRRDRACGPSWIYSREVASLIRVDVPDAGDDGLVHEDRLDGSPIRAKCYCEIFEADDRTVEPIGGRYELRTDVGMLIGEPHSTEQPRIVEPEDLSVLEVKQHPDVRVVGFPLANVHGSCCQSK